MSLDNEMDSLVSIKAFGVGGGGSNAVSRMAQDASASVEYIAVNTDAQALLKATTPIKLRIGDQLTRGLGAGGDPEIGADAAEESRDDIYEVVKGADMVFIAAGMGGGTGTGAAPIIAQIAKESGALTIGIVTKPFGFEGQRRARQAEQGIAKMHDAVDSLIVIPNERLLQVAGAEASWKDAFGLADDILRSGVHAISQLVTVPGEINLDFADIRSVMSNSGQSIMAIGEGRGTTRAVDAARSAIENPLLEVDITGATGVLFSITAGPDLALSEIHEAAAVIASAVDPDANIIFGVVPDDKMVDNDIRLTLIATGYEANTPSEEAVVDEILQQALGDGDFDLPPFLRRKGRIVH
jgi:cell division protein FtsZ